MRVRRRRFLPTLCVHLLILCVGVWLSGATGVALAQSPSAAGTGSAQEAGQLQEILVTAEKRSTNLQSTPIAVTALSADTLEQNQVRDLKDIQSLVPNFKMGDAQGIAQITIRGIGSSTFLPGYEGAVAVNENEVYISRSIAQQAGLFDVSSIEVLRGPQGTLFGRNATAGAVNIATAQPTAQLSGYLRQSVGNYGESRTDAAIGGPIEDDKLMVRIAAFRETHEGYGTNIVTGTGIDDKDDYGVRGTLLYKPVDTLSATLIAEYFNENDHSGAFHYFGAAGLTGIPGALGAPPLFVIQGGYAPTNVRDVANQIDPEFALRTEAVTGILQWTNGGAVSVKSITGYRTQKANFTYEYDGGFPASIYEIAGEPAHQVSEEVQVHYDTSNLHLTGGLYYFHEDDSLDPGQVIVSTFDADFFFKVPFTQAGFVTAGNQVADLSTNAAAAFAQGTYRLTQDLSITAGVRYSVERKHAIEQFGIDFSFPSYPGPNPLPAPVDLHPATFYSVTPKFGIQYQWDPETLLYASYSQGFKSGGFDVAIADPKPYQPEHLTDYEMGIKTTFFSRLRANVSAFYYDYTDLQVQQVVDLAVQTGNAATARDYGLEAELGYLVTAAFRIDLSAAWTHARYGRYCGADPALPNAVTPTSCPLVGGSLPPNEANFSGKSLDNAPDYQATLAPQYTWSLPVGSLVARGEAEYSSRFYFAPGNEALLSQGAYVKGNLFATYRPDEAWEVTGYVRNVANATTRTSALVASVLAFNPVLGSLTPPRLFGITVQYRF
jgi:iron complex outermembrane recepter protein